MGANYRIKFNPSSMEIEIEGSQQFVETYFDRVQSLFLSLAEEVRAEAGKKTRPPRKAVQARKGAGSREVWKKAKGKRRQPGRRKEGSSNTDKVIALLRESPDGISTADLKAKTGLTEQQIWGVIYAAEKQGRVRKMKRGLYTAGPAAQTETAG
jgi:predicted Rossmann fold nucleotide-binding protein DprA/Smf involved in DNA uptake